MLRRYRLAGLNCVHCAGKIERGAGEFPGVEKSELALSVQKLTLTLADGADAAAIDAALTGLTAALEPDVKVICLDGEDFAAKEREAEAERREEERLELAKLGVGAALMLASLPMSGAARLIVQIGAYLILGAEVLLAAAKAVRRRDLGEELLMALATIGALCLGETLEACAVMLFYRVGEWLQGKAVEGSRRRISALMALKPDKARLVLGDEILDIEASGVAPGDVIEVRPGERVALDGTVVSGRSDLDNSALTGESRPVGAAEGDSVSAGAVNLTGVLRVRVDRPMEESAVARILEMTQNAAEQKADSERTLTRFARVYTPCVTGAAVVIALAGGLVSGQWREWIYRALLLLMMSCPCALVLSVPLTFFAGIGAASRRGILFKGGQALENMAKAAVYCFDKTGTLTTGELSVDSVRAVNPGEEHDVLRAAWFCERQSAHPIARAVTAAVTDRIDEEIEDLQEWAGEGIECVCEGSGYAAGNARLMARLGVDIPNEYGDAMVHVAKDGEYIGCVDLSDRPRAETPDTIGRLRALGAAGLSILTGDGEAAAKRVASQCGIDECHALLMPEDKLRLMEEKKRGAAGIGTVIYVGDGINDAPVLTAADVGVAMGAMGRDAAIEAADVVLMEDSIAGTANAVELARRVMGIMKQNIIFAIAAKLLVMLLGLLGLANLWLAVIADVGVALLCVLNALRASKSNI